MDGGELDRLGHPLQHEAVDHRPHQLHQRVGVAGGHDAGGDPGADPLRVGVAHRLEDPGGALHHGGHVFAAGGRQGLGEEEDPRLTAVMERVHRLHLGVEPVDGVRLGLDAREDELHLLEHQLLEGGLHDVGLRGEVVEQRGALDLQGLGKPAHGHVEALPLHHRHRLPGQGAALLVLRGAAHG